MTRNPEVAALVWEYEQTGEAFAALARHAGLIPPSAAAPGQPPVDSDHLDRWLGAVGEQLGVSIESTTAKYRDVDAALAAMRPAIVHLSEGMLLIVGSRRAALSCLCPDGVIRRIARPLVVRAVQSVFEGTDRARISRVLEGTTLSPAARERAASAMLTDCIGGSKVLWAWVLRLPAGAPFVRQVRIAGLFRVIATLLAAHVGQYVLYLTAWWAIGGAILQGRLERGWMWGWAVLLLAGLPLTLLSRWCQGKLAIGLGALLRRRLLAGALELPPQVLRRDGSGRLLGRTIEAETLESAALAGGFSSVLAVLELVLAVPVLVAGAGGWLHAAVFAGWLGVGTVFATRLAMVRQQTTDQRLAVTGLTIERIAGHRTRLVQDLPERWHLGEDEALATYLARTDRFDRRALMLSSFTARGWLVVGLAGLAPAFIRGADPIALATGLGAVMLSWQSMTKLWQGFDQLAAAHVAWRRVAPLFHAASAAYPGPPGSSNATAGVPRRRFAAPEFVVSPPPRDGEPVLEAVDVSFRHAGRASDVLTGCDLVIRRGDRILMQGTSGSGKSTFASLLTGMQTPRSGLVLARGLDMSCLGEIGWRARVSAAPQFHENHVLTETLAFNLLMGRAWPPTDLDLTDAKDICEEIGLGPLIRRMPGGIHQMVGETGWQLSHGEKSRLFIARALLQNSDVIILDESLAALDPENMAATLRCMRARAPALVVIAHP